MAIQFVCPNCSKQHNAPAEFAGRQARCTCGAVLVVPPLSPQPAMAAATNPATVPPATPPHVSPNPSSTASGPANPGTWEAEPGTYPKPTAKLSPLAKILANRRLLGIGAGVAAGAIILLLLMVWMFFGRGGISEAMRYLPNDCLVVGTTNVDEVMSSALYQQMKKDVPNFEESERDVEQNLGIAPANISRISVAAGGKMDSSGNADFVAVIRLKKAVSASDVKSNKKVSPFQKDVKFEDVKIGNLTAFEETYLLSHADDKANRIHGEAFCMAESTLMVACPKLDVLKRILERGKSPEISEGMQNAMRETNFSKTLAVAVNVKGLVASSDFARGIRQSIGAAPSLGSLGNLGDETFQQNLLGLAVEAGLDSSKLTVDATLLCKDAKFAEDAKKILEGSQVVARNALKAAHGVPREAADVVDSIKFSVSGAKVKGSLQTSLEPFLKGIPENLRRAQMSARISSAKVQVELLDKALQTYYLDMGSFPSQSVGLQALRVEPRDLRGSNKWAGPYLDREIPADPWGKPYQYAYPPRMNRDKSDVSTVSPDNQIIGNWTEEATGR